MHTVCYNTFVQDQRASCPQRRSREHYCSFVFCNGRYPRPICRGCCLRRSFVEGASSDGGSNIPGSTFAALPGALQERVAQRNRAVHSLVCRRISFPVVAGHVAPDWGSCLSRVRRSRLFLIPGCHRIGSQKFFQTVSRLNIATENPCWYRRVFLLPLFLISRYTLIYESRTSW
jgi:hypothetical protein